MSSETELRKWLHRVEKSHLENITFAMRVWNSMEFNLLTKHEIITEECCKIVSKLSEEVKTAEDIDSMWNVVNEFLGMKCSSGAVANSVKIALCKTVVDVVKSMNCQRCIVYKALVTMLQNTAMQGFFKSNAKYFGMVAGLSIDYLKKLLEKESDLNRSDLDVVKVVQITKNFIKQTPFLNDFRKPFVKYLLVPLSELFIDLRKDKIVDESDFFNILHEIYFADNDNENPMNHMLLHPENEEFTYLLNVPIHAFMLIVEGVFQSVKVATTIQAAFIKYLFDTYFNQSNEKFANENEMLMSLSMFLSLLKRYDVPLSLKIDGINATEFIGKKIECLNITQSNLYEILLVLCASIELNPMMLEQSTMSLVVKCMLHRKDDRTVVAFERFLILIIDMYRRLSRSEKFISNLTRTMWQKLSDFKLSKKIKRKIGAIDCNSSMNDSPKRLRIDSDGNVSTPVALNENNELNRSQLFLELLNESICSNETKPLSSLGSESNTHWRNIQFAWPNRVGEEFSKYISGLVSKPSLVVWKTLIFTMTDYIKLIKNGDLSENSLFLIDWTSALLCQYFHGCRLAEQSDKTWELIEENRKLQRNLLKDFGSAILSQEHNIRTMNAFLSLCHASGNFDLLSWFYCPDSITPDQIERSIGCHSNDFVHSYLQPTEWVLIEQRISNFGKHECRSNLNRLYLQKVKSKLMLKSSNGTVDVADPLLSSILADHGLNELNDILLDETANQWFIEQLTRSQKIHVARSVVELDCDVTRSSNLVRALARRVENQEFLDFLAVALFERIGVHASGQTIKRIDFMEVFAGNESICKDVVRQLKNVSACEVHLEKPSELQIAFELLDDIPLGFVSATFKNILFHLTLGLLLQHTNQITIRSCCRYLKKFLLHGDSPDVFRFLKIKQLPRIFDHFGTDANVMYKFFFEKKLIELDPSTSKVLDELLQLIQNEANENSICCSYLDVGIHLLNLLNKIKCKEFSAQYRDVILTKIREFFDEKNARSQVDEEAFVSKTVSGFVNIVSNINEFDETLKRIVGIYFKHM
ncbi:hypothetical protein Bhyg_02764 [Pseudolycoriella hygida]|uniref:Uncharacterized protein n=1 Tax=Pseudolycoriella hygida TaxID=35572 RepID=A0A9Q0ND80_9DIPT|nr:hypothetical protein Bhyg_02764 [Pseudolycoriella hygida]